MFQILWYILLLLAYANASLSSSNLQRNDTVLEELGASATTSVSSSTVSIILDTVLVGANESSTTSEFRESSPRNNARLAPMRITCIAIGSRGDVQPYIALAKELMKDSHNVTIATHAEFQGWIQSHGVGFALIAGDPTKIMKHIVVDGQVAFSLWMRSWLDDLLHSIWIAAQDAQLIIDSPGSFGGIHVAQKLGIPYYRHMPFLWSRTKHYQHPFDTPSLNLLGINRSHYRVYLGHIVIEEITWKASEGIINKWRKHTLGLPAIHHLGNIQKFGIPYIYSYSQFVVPPPPDWPAWIYTSGYWFLDSPDLHWKAPQSLTDFISFDRDIPIVYIGFGSIVVKNAKEMTNTIIRAVGQAGVRAIIAKGWSDRAFSTLVGQEEIYPDYIYMIDKVPHDWLFPQMDAVLHHGGAGTTAAGLKAGKPSIIHPFISDQHFWAARIKELNVGVRIRTLDEKSLSHALILVTKGNHDFKENAALLGAKIRAERGVENAVDFIYGNIEFSRNQILALPSGSRLDSKFA